MPVFVVSGFREEEVAAQTARLAHRVHHLSEQVFVAEILGLLTGATAFDDLPAEPLDLVRRRVAEVRIERIS